MTYHVPVRTPACRNRSLTTTATTGITIFGCDHDESALFREMAPRFGVVPTPTEAALCEATADLAVGNRCVSVGHKTPVGRPTLEALSRAGVEYISTQERRHQPHRRGLRSERRHRGRERRLLTRQRRRLHPDADTDGAAPRQDDHPPYRRSRLPTRHLRGRELRDLTVGVVGTGRIGSAVIDRLRGFGCRILAYDRRPRVDADYVPLDELMRHSDIVTLHTPLTAQTHHLLDRGGSQQMKPGAFIVNTGRGALIDTAGARRGAGERRAGRRGAGRRSRARRGSSTPITRRAARRRSAAATAGMPNVLITPHTAYYTDHALSDTIESTSSTA